MRSNINWSSRLYFRNNFRPGYLSENSQCNANYNQSQLELSQVQYQLDFANNQISDLESQLTSLQDQNLSLSFQIDSLLLLLNSIQVEDGFSQEDVINAYEYFLILK